LFTIKLRYIALWLNPGFRCKNPACNYEVRYGHMRISKYLGSDSIQETEVGNTQLWVFVLYVKVGPKWMQFLCFGGGICLNCTDSIQDTQVGNTQIWVFVLLMKTDPKWKQLLCVGGGIYLFLSIILNIQVGNTQICVFVLLMKVEPKRKQYLCLGRGIHLLRPVQPERGHQHGTPCLPHDQRHGGTDPVLHVLVRCVRNRTVCWA